MKQQITPELLRALPMTPLETHLKEVYLSRADLHGQVLDANDIPAYYQWMSDTFRGQKESILSTETLSRILRGGMVGNLGSRLQLDPSDKSVLQDLSTIFTSSSESYFFAESEDISASISLRYMPPSWEENAYFELFYSFSGCCPMTFKGETLLLRPGTVILVPPSTVKAYTCKQDDCILFLSKIRASTFSKVFWSHLTNQNLMSFFFRQALSGQSNITYLKFETNQDQELEHILCSIYSEYNKSSIYRHRLLNTLMSLFFLRLLTDYEKTAQLSKKSDFAWKPEYIQMLRYIQGNFATVTLAELCRKYNYSDRQAIRIIQSCTGKTLSQLLTRLKMEKAAELITGQTMPLTRIASEMGYTTLSSFCRAFRHYFGCTPKRYQLEKSDSLERH